MTISVCWYMSILHSLWNTHFQPPDVFKGQLFVVCNNNSARGCDPGMMGGKPPPPMILVSRVDDVMQDYPL